MAPKKDLIVNTAMLTGASAKAKQTAQRNAKEEQRKGQKKSNSDFIRLDLRPDGLDLKEHLRNAAADETKETGKNITVTKYIQNLIIADMRVKDKQDRRKDLAEMLYSVSDKDLDALEIVIKALCK